MAKKLSRNSFQLLSDLLQANESKMAKLLLENTFFIAPSLASKVVFPNHARPSREFHPEKHKKDSSVFEGKAVKITDNKKARDAFGRLTGFKLNGDVRDVAIGWEVAHIWGHVYDPDCFTAGWNMCLLPNFLRDLTEEQNSLEYFQKVIQQVSYDLYFRGRTVPKDFIRDQNLKLEEIIPLEELNILYPKNSKVA